MSRRDVREWYGYAFGLPDRHPTGFLWCGSMPTWSRPVPLRGGLETCGAWWFENWIVDASKGNFGFFLLIAISPNSSIEFGFEIDRFVIILVLRFVVWRSCYQETRGWGNDNLFCCCAACEGVWWMPWQTVPMKDV